MNAKSASFPLATSAPSRRANSGFPVADTAIFQGKFIVSGKRIATPVSKSAEMRSGISLFLHPVNKMHRVVNAADKNDDAADFVFRHLSLKFLKFRAVLIHIIGIYADMDHLPDLFVERHFFEFFVRPFICFLVGRKFCCAETGKIKLVEIENKITKHNKNLIIIFYN